VKFDEFVRSLDEDTVRSVRASTIRVAEARRTTLAQVFEDVDEARKRAAAVKSYVLDNLRDLLVQLESSCRANGIQVHWAKDAASANRAVLDVCKRVAPEGALVVKAKSMATEEIHLNAHLIEAGHTPVETDLGEFVVQIDKDTPSHIVAPIIHKDRRQIAASFERENLGPYTEQPEELAMQARAHLRAQFRRADVGVSGVNFAIASTGRLVIVENEGNNRYCTTAPRVHVAVMGIEKVLPSEDDLTLFLRLLAGSATGQRLTVYTHMIAGPRRLGLDGPEEVHLVLLDNGRTRVMNSDYRDILRCIRCGACLNVCPVYRCSSGHAYGHVYPGPVGAVLAPALEGIEPHGQLAKASSLCGACQEVCPVDIPIPDMLLRLRSQDVRNRGASWKCFGTTAQSAMFWRAGLKLLPIVGLPPAWREFRDQPRKGRDFRKWWHGRP
jgi:L-lactate dehydrogenase complex protein LldF